jgi:hypothetical protein
VRYIQDQREYHRKKMLQEEYHEFLHKQATEYDERYRCGLIQSSLTRRMESLADFHTPALKDRTKLKAPLRGEKCPNFRPVETGCE